MGERGSEKVCPETAFTGARLGELQGGGAVIKCQLLEEMSRYEGRRSKEDDEKEEDEGAAKRMIRRKTQQRG